MIHLRIASAHDGNADGDAQDHQHDGYDVCPHRNGPSSRRDKNRTLPVTLSQNAVAFVSVVVTDCWTTKVHRVRPIPFGTCTRIQGVTPDHWRGLPRQARAEGRAHSPQRLCNTTAFLLDVEAYVHSLFLAHLQQSEAQAVDMVQGPRPLPSSKA